MKRTLNNTNRQKITQDQYSVLSGPSSNFEQLVVEWDISSLGLDPKNLLHIEFSITGARKRIDLGEVGSGQGKTQIENPFKNAITMKTFFRASLDVTDGPRLWTAVSTGKSLITALQDNDQSSILPIVPVSNLGRLWKLNYDGDPVLEVCNTNESFSLLKQNPVFFGSLVPAIVQEIAQRYLLGIEGSRQWAHWPLFFEKLGVGTEKLDEYDSLEAESRFAAIIEKSHEMADEFASMSDVVNKVLDRLKVVEDD